MQYEKEGIISSSVKMMKSVKKDETSGICDGLASSNSEKDGFVIIEDVVSSLVKTQECDKKDKTSTKAEEFKDTNRISSSDSEVSVTEEGCSPPNSTSKDSFKICTLIFYL